MRGAHRHCLSTLGLAQRHQPVLQCREQMLHLVGAARHLRPEALLGGVEPRSTLRVHWACRFAALKELVPHNGKLDKAAFLYQTVEYLKQLQVRLLWGPACGCCGGLHAARA